MHTLLFCFLLFTTPAANVKGHANNRVIESRMMADTGFFIRKSYDKNLEKNLKILLHKKALPDETVAYLIPRTKDEWDLYYSYKTESPEFTRAFYKLDNLIGTDAIFNRSNTLKLYLNMSLFVDGDYADKYFADANFIIKKQKKQFCRIYPTLSKEIQDLFEEAWQNCRK